MTIKIEQPDKQQLDQMGIDSWSSWGCGVETFDWKYSSEEVAYILKGKVIVSTDQGDVIIQKGDLVTFPKGLACTWKVEEPIEKVYTFR
ncbi:MAG: cupin domain-containing protein [Spirochaetes bacterium]|nr:cupin domain-containing protein [Spirochaetota bacterium]